MRHKQTPYERYLILGRVIAYARTRDILEQLEVEERSARFWDGISAGDIQTRFYDSVDFDLDEYLLGEVRYGRKERLEAA